MTSAVLPFGAQIASTVLNASENGAAGAPVLETLADLLKILRENPPKALPMLQSTCSLLGLYLNASLERVLIDSVNDTRYGFRSFLESRKYAASSIRSYVNYVRILLKNAKELGWRPNQTVSQEWFDLLELAVEKKCVDVVKDIARMRLSPTDVTIEDVDNWVEIRIQQGRSYSWAVGRKKRFWRLLRDCGCTEQTPKCFLRARNYGILLQHLPSPLKTEVEALLKWKQAPYALDRPKFAQHRAVTARNLRRAICQVYGFTVNIQGRSDVASMADLIQKRIIGDYVEWCINEREVGARSLQCNLSLLRGALVQHPAYTTLDIAWFKPLLDSLPAEGESELKKRKAEKYLDYSIVEAIPAMIRAGRPAAERKGGALAARLAMEELLMRWLITLPWRQRNIRECRIGGPTPNLFKGRIPHYSDISKPEWVTREEANNPVAAFWQFHFSAHETKTGCEVSALLPRQLIGILEEYLKDFRPKLIRGADPLTLLVGRKGKPMEITQMTQTVSDLTLRHAGRRVSPHPFRDIVAYTWLKEHPKDYLTLSKMLWHRNINTTIRIYGSRFNESNGVSAMESWLDERAAQAA